MARFVFLTVIDSKFHLMAAAGRPTMVASLALIYTSDPTDADGRYVVMHGLDSPIIVYLAFVRT